MIIVWWLLFVLGVYIAICLLYFTLIFIWFFIKERLIDYDEKEKEFKFYDE